MSSKSAPVDAGQEPGSSQDSNQSSKMEDFKQEEPVASQQAGLLARARDGAKALADGYLPASIAHPVDSLIDGLSSLSVSAAEKIGITAHGYVDRAAESIRSVGNSYLPAKGGDEASGEQEEEASGEEEAQEQEDQSGGEEQGGQGGGLVDSAAAAAEKIKNIGGNAARLTKQAAFKLMPKEGAAEAGGEAGGDEAGQDTQRQRRRRRHPKAKKGGGAGEAKEQDAPAPEAQGGAGGEGGGEGVKKQGARRRWHRLRKAVGTPEIAAMGGQEAEGAEDAAAEGGKAKQPRRKHRRAHKAAGASAEAPEAEKAGVEEKAEPPAKSGPAKKAAKEEGPEPKEKAPPASEIKKPLNKKQRPPLEGIGDRGARAQQGQGSSAAKQAPGNKSLAAAGTESGNQAVSPSEVKMHPQLVRQNAKWDLFEGLNYTPNAASNTPNTPLSGNGSANASLSQNQSRPLNPNASEFVPRTPEELHRARMKRKRHGVHHRHGNAPQPVAA